MNFSNNLGGEIGIRLSKNNIFNWFNINKNRIYFLWSSEYIAKRLINILYNYEFINSSSNNKEKIKLKEIILYHVRRLLIEFKNKNYYEVNSYEMKAFILSSIILKNNIDKSNLIVKK